jgi:hypothetical protein
VIVGRLVKVSGASWREFSVPELAGQGSVRLASMVGWAASWARCSAMDARQRFDLGLDCDVVGERRGVARPEAISTAAGNRFIHFLSSTKPYFSRHRARLRRETRRRLWLHCAAVHGCGGVGVGA